MIKVTEIHEVFYNKKNEHQKTESRPYSKEFKCERDLQCHRIDLERIFSMSASEKQRIEVYFTQCEIREVKQEEEIVGPEFISRKPKFKRQQ